MLNAEQIYTTRFATKRAINRREDPSAWECVPAPGGKGYTIVPAGSVERKPKKAKAPKAEPVKVDLATLPPPNATRAGEIKRAKAAAAEAKKAKANGAGTDEAKKPGGKRAELLAACEAGKLPPVPDFSAETHKRFRPRLAELVALVKAGDVKGLKAYPIKPISTSPKAMDRYRNLAVIALTAQAKG